MAISYSPESLRAKVRVGWADILIFIVIFGLFFSLKHLGHDMQAKFSPGVRMQINLSPRALPGYAARSLLRMFIAFAASILFTFVYGYIAAHNLTARKLLVPLLDILQSVPVLGFLSITVTAFMALFPGSLLGLECASIFAIFTGQAWNMTFSFYQSLITIPKELREAATVYQLNWWQRFIKLEVPFSMIGLVWNGMMSFGGGWFFLAASEAITVLNNNFLLPGIGSYMAVAVAKGNVKAELWAIATMVLIVILVDQLFWRPIVAWSQKFKFEQTDSSNEPTSVVLDIIRQSKALPWMTLNVLVPIIQLPNILFKHANRFVNSNDAAANYTKILIRCALSASAFAEIWILFHQTFFGSTPALALGSLQFYLPSIFGMAVSLLIVISLWAPTDVTKVSVKAAVSLALFIGISIALYRAFEVVRAGVTLHMLSYVLYLTFLTLLRVISMVVFATVVWTPIGVAIGFSPKLSRIAQPLVQIGASFPANLLFPVVVLGFIYLHVSLNWGSVILIALGTQWYILFNVIAGASSVPSDLREAATVFRLRGWDLWRTLILPAIFPAWVTGALTAAGGAWNASIVAEIAVSGPTTLHAQGIGNYIAVETTNGDWAGIIVGIGMMSLFVVVLNKLVWRRLYALGETKFGLG